MNRTTAMSTIQQKGKDKSQSVNVLEIPTSELVSLCKDPQTLLTVINLAYQQGYKLAQEQCHRFYRMMFAGQDELSIKN